MTVAKIQKTKKEEEPRGYLTFATIPESVTMECIKIGIIDTGCTMTVVGEPWYQAFKPSVSFKSTECRPDKTSINFGDCKKVFSRRNVKIPVTIEDLNCFISVEIVPVNIPLLISIKSLSLMSTHLNFSTNTLELKNGSYVSLVKWSTGHIGIDISSTDNIRPNVLFTKKELDKTEMMKFHRQFGQCGVDRLCRLVTNAGGVAKRNDIQEIVDNCEVCVKFGCPKRNLQYRCH